MHLPELSDVANVRLSMSSVAVPTLQSMVRCEVTLLFSDLFGYSAFTEACKVTEVAAVMTVIKQEAARIVRSYGGIINQFVGDEIVAIFGFPERVNDHAQRAGCAALELHAAVRSAHISRILAGERDLAMHSGIDSGVLLIDSRDVRDGLFSLTGVAMNRAARLRSLAKRDEILASEQAHRALGRFFVTEARAPQLLKGILEAVVPYRLIARRTLPLIATPAERGRVRRELAALCEAWNLVQHGGRIVELRGPCGSGKSRVLSAFAEQFEDHPARLFVAECRDTDRTPLSALKRMLRDHLQRLGRTTAAERRRRAAALTAASRQLASHVAVIAPLSAALGWDAARPSITQPDDSVIPSLVQFLAEYLAAVGPSVMVIDDAQWLDPGSRIVLSALAAQLKSGGHLLVYAVRDELEHLAALAQLRTALPEDIRTHIALGPLSAEQLSALIADYLEIAGEVDRDLVDEVALLTDGTPLGALELLRFAVEQGHLQQHAGRWQFDTAWRSMKLPRSAKELIRLRLASLPRQYDRVLQAVALLGTPVRLETLIAAGCDCAASIDAALHAALHARLMLRTQDGAHTFVHESLREALLRDLSDAERRARNRALAQSLSSNGHTAGASLYLVARLYAASDLEADPARAYSVLRRAALQAIRACDDGLAHSFLLPARAAALAAGLELERDFYVDLAETSLRVGEVRESLEYFEAALARSSRGPERAHVFGRIAWIHHFESNVEACHDALTSALAECGRSTDLETLCTLYVACFRAALEEGQIFRLAASGARLAGLVGRLPNCRARVNAELVLAFAKSWVGATAASARALAHAERVAELLGDPIARTACHRVRHVIAGWRDNLIEAERCALLCHASAHWMEQTEYYHLCVGMYATETARGRPEHAWMWIERALGRVRHDGQSPALLSVLESAGYATLLTLGQTAPARAFEERMRKVKRAPLRPGSYFYLLCFQSRLQALIACEQFDDQFDALVDEFERWVPNPGHGHLIMAGSFYIHLGHARLHQCLQENTVKATSLAALESASKRLDMATRRRAGAAHALLMKAACAWLRGSKKSSVLLTEAERLAELHGYPFVNCQANRLRAHMLRASGNFDAAHDHARVAALLAQQYSLTPLLKAIGREFTTYWQTG